MSVYRDENCGIDVPHRHTGDIVESHYVQYWCTTVSMWVNFEDRCKVPDCDHMKARVQTTTTETIDILDELTLKYGTPLVRYVRDRMQEMINDRLFLGEDAFHEKYGWL